LGTIVALLFLALITLSAFIVGVVKEKIVTQQANENRGYAEESIPVRSIAWTTSAVFAGLTAVILFFSTFVIVGATQVGVPVSFGKVGQPLDPGVHFVAPWASVEEYPIRPITVQLTGEHKVIARTADAGQMSVEIAARWRVERHSAKELYFQTRTGDINAISENIVLPNLRQAVGQIYSVTGNLDAISDRERVSEEIRIQLNKQLVPYGILIDSVQMRSVEPDEATAHTISLYNSQQQATRIAQEATKTAVVEAERRLIEAKGLEAAGKSVANLTPAQLQVICAQVWQQVVSKGIDKNVVVYTNPCSDAKSLIVNTK
jgi:regulator of protease activity HflC (stomatin/prohibitin superfamily)